jgi:hypothetical protein
MHPSNNPPPLRFTIEGNPGDGAVNVSTFNVPGRGRVSSARAKAFRARALAAGSLAFRTGQPLSAAALRSAKTFGVGIAAYWSRQSHVHGVDVPLGDIDAPIKAVLDALEVIGLYGPGGKDVLVLELRPSKHYDKERPRIEVEVWGVS